MIAPNSLACYTMGTVQVEEVGDSQARLTPLGEKRCPDRDRQVEEVGDSQARLNVHTICATSSRRGQVEEVGDSQARLKRVMLGHAEDIDAQ